MASKETRRKVLKVSKMKEANNRCKDEGNDDGVSHYMTLYLSWKMLQEVAWLFSAENIFMGPIQ